MKVGDNAEPVVDNRLTEIVNKISYDPKDPYDTPEEHAECDDLITKIFSWTGKDGTFSTWRERHIFLRGFHSGRKTKFFAKFDETPEMWSDEAQYYESGQEVGYVVSIVYLCLFAYIGAQFGLTLGVDVVTGVLKGLIGTLI